MTDGNAADQPRLFRTPLPREILEQSSSGQGKRRLLARVIPAKTTNVPIYCNNNFDGSPVAFAGKQRAVALNISTFVSLVAYGYTNASELGPFLDVKKTKIVFE